MIFYINRFRCLIGINDLWSFCLHLANVDRIVIFEPSPLVTPSHMTLGLRRHVKFALNFFAGSKWKCHQQASSIMVNKDTRYIVRQNMTKIHWLWISHTYLSNQVQKKSVSGLKAVNGWLSHILSITIVFMTFIHITYFLICHNKLMAFYIKLLSNTVFEIQLHMTYS